MADEPREIEPPRHIEVVFVDGAAEPVVRLFEPGPVPPYPWHRRMRWPVFLFLATCASTALSHGLYEGQGRYYFVPSLGLPYAAAVMTILLTHELGHWIQARRYGLPASLPYFIPMPFSPIGTMGAVIIMRGGMGTRRSLFDVGISGPLAGLVPTLAFCVWGMAHAVPVRHNLANEFGDPLLIQWMAGWFLRPLGPDETFAIGPVGFAGWVGLLLTSINLMPIGQLDGGHILHALLPRWSRYVAWMFMAVAAASMLATGARTWWLMLMLLLLIGPAHPPTANDAEPLGWGRIALGWATLAFLIISFTPEPFSFAR